MVVVNQNNGTLFGGASLDKNKFSKILSSVI